MAIDVKAQDTGLWVDLVVAGTRTKALAFDATLDFLEACENMVNDWPEGEVGEESDIMKMLKFRKDLKEWQTTCILLFKDEYT